MAALGRCSSSVDFSVVDLLAAVCADKDRAQVFFFFITLKSLCALNTSPPRNQVIVLLLLYYSQKSMSLKYEPFSGDRRAADRGGVREGGEVFFFFITLKPS